MDRISIPASVEELTANLDGINRLLTAKQWERAAIVYAWTEPEVSGGRPVSGGNPPLMNLVRFAALGITGLRDRQQVRLYRAAWESAAEDGQSSLDIKPGDEVNLPTLPWKDHFGEPTADVQQRVFRQVLREPDSIRAAVEDDPSLAYKIAGAAMAIPASRSMVEAMVRNEERITEMPRVLQPVPRPEADYSQDLRYGVNNLLRVLSAMRDGKWSPDAMETTLLRFLSQAFAEIATDQQKPTSYDVIDEIEAFLVTQR